MTDKDNNVGNASNVIDFKAWATQRSRRRHPSRWLTTAPQPDLDDHSPAALWRADFEVHADQHAQVTTSGMWVLAPVVERALRESLPVFQLGEVGTGRHLLDTACGTVSEHHLQALRFFIIESQEHARLLALICSELDIDMIDEHWTERALRAARHHRGARLELLTIVIAQLISAEVYSMLAEGVGDPTISRIFARLHADELRHLEFHSATLPEHLEWSPRTTKVIHRAWTGIATLATIAVVWENRRLVSACGRSHRSVFIDLRQAISAQGLRLFGS